jgi:hypothetical protein
MSDTVSSYLPPMIYDKGEIDSSFSVLSDELNKSLPTIINNYKNAQAASKTSTTQINNSEDLLLRKDVQNFVDSHLTKFKQNLFEQIDAHITETIEKKMQIQKNIPKKRDLLASFYSFEAQFDGEFESKIEQLFDLISESRASGRTIKSALLEEELQACGAFWAEFVQDATMPDGSECKPNTNFQKVWQIKNTGKLDWNASHFPVKLMCIGGTLFNNQPFVQVNDTRVGETTNIAVDLTAPLNPGINYSEWVLSCNGFQFGPRVWCSVEVIGNQDKEINNISLNSVLSSQISTNRDYNKTAEDMPVSKNEFDSNIKRSSSSIETNQNDDDDDGDNDEFVVVPDCFDLSKKWALKQKQDENNDCFLNNSKKQSVQMHSFYTEKGDDIDFDDSASINSRSTSPHSLLNKTFDEYQNTINDEMVVLNKSTDTISIINEDKKEVKKEENVVTEPAKKIESSRAEGLSQLNSIIENEQAEIRIKKIDLKKLADQNYYDPALSISSSVTSTFDKMKTAISNLGRPSFVGPAGFGSLDLPTTQNQNEDDVKFLINKLVQMGFADRKTNEKLLKKYDNNIQRVIEHILEKSDNNWAENR